MAEPCYLPIPIEEPKSSVSEVQTSFYTRQAKFEEVKSLITSSKPVQRPNRTYSIHDSMEEIPPTAKALDRLVDRFPAPKEWDNE